MLKIYGCSIALLSLFSISLFFLDFFNSSFPPKFNNKKKTTVFKNICNCQQDKNEAVQQLKFIAEYLTQSLGSP